MKDKMLRRWLDDAEWLKEQLAMETEREEQPPLEQVQQQGLTVVLIPTKVGSTACQPKSFERAPPGPTEGAPTGPSGTERC
jgi:hypothetical protein